jgi:hypothetical protein
MTVPSPAGRNSQVSSPQRAERRALAAARISRVADDQEHPEDGQDVDDAFDRHVGEVLEQEAGLLREQTDLLIATGSISVQRPTGVLTAHLRPPTWWRRGELEVRAATAGSSGSACIPLSRAAYRDHTGLRGEIRLQLAVQLAWLAEE